MCVAPIVYTDTHSIQRDIQHVKSAVAAAGVQEAFLPVVAPASAAFNAVNEYYASDEEYVYALAEALRHEYLAIYEAGLLLQVDDAVLANAYDHLMALGRDVYRKWAEMRIEALNHALRGIPADRVRYHLCYGSWHAPHMADAPLEDIVDLILRVNAGAYSIEAANVRHEHEWRLWEDVKLADGKSLIPGVVTHHTISVEHPRLVADRLVRYARLLGRENVIGGTDCGFQQGPASARPSHGDVGQAARTRRRRSPGEPGALARLAPQPCKLRNEGQAPTGQPPLLHLAFDVQASALTVGPLFLRHHPEDFELVAVGVLRVQAQAGAMVVHADQRVRRDQRVTGAGQFGQRVHLPGEVVQAHTFAARWIGCVRADAEQPQVMIVVGVRAGPEEVGPVAHVRGDHEPEHILIEAAARSALRT